MFVSEAAIRYFMGLRLSPIDCKMLAPMLYTTTGMEPRKYTRKYSTDWGSTSGGVPIRTRICGVSHAPTTVSTPPAAKPSATEVCTERSSPSASCEPNCRAISTPAPSDTPLMKPTISWIRLLDEPTAARACPPRKLPTISESAALYSGWNKLLKKMGMANKRATMPPLNA